LRFVLIDEIIIVPQSGLVKFFLVLRSLQIALSWQGEELSPFSPGSEYPEMLVIHPPPHPRSGMQREYQEKRGESYASFVELGEV
jgi:hypothetical protein